MSRIEKIDVSVGAGIISVFKRMPQKLERVFAEFIDNSIQSYEDHKDILDKINNGICRVDITWNKNEIRIKDNCFGMNTEELGRALKLNSPKGHYSEHAKSQYGMGLKIAAAYLGDWYSINTTRYDSDERYYSIVDIEDWRVNNPTEIDNEITTSEKSVHETEIIIKKLQKHLNTTIDKSLKERLSIIYGRDLATGSLELNFNGYPIYAQDPTLRINEETGSEYFGSFSDSFEYNGLKYEYSGWIGILRKASTENAGFTLIQANRGIILNYRPYEIFLKSNSFQYQRLVGEIELEDKKCWKVTFNKDNFIWDDGLEKAFTYSLSQNPTIIEFKTIAGKLRKDVTPVITNEDIAKSQKKLEERYKNINIDNEKTYQELPKSDDPIINIPVTEDQPSVIVPINFESIEYKFDIKVIEDNLTADWYSLERKSENNEYYIIINGSSTYFKNYNKKESKDLIINFAIALALAQISSKRVGLKPQDSNIFINQLNQIIKSID